MQIKEAVKKIHDEAEKRVSVQCDDYHHHTAVYGCLGGDEDAVTICKLCETVNFLLLKIEEFQKGLEHFSIQLPD